MLTIDVEDWFQVENFKPWIPFSTWDQRELRVERNVHRLLDLFDSIESPGKLEARGQEVEISPRTYQTPKLPGFHASRPPNHAASQLQASGSELPSIPASQPQAERRPKATFFVLGWIADRLPNLVREIQDRGHEVASHGCNHELPNLLSAKDLKMDLIDSKKRLEDITGAAVFGYRAPSFAINDDILKSIEDAGYLYDSSYNSFSLHGRYGKISLNGTGKKGIAHKISDNFYELPLSNLRIAGQTLPWGGGGYFRFAPFSLLRRGVQSILEKDGAYAFYLHPWELDPSQPRVKNASMNYKLRHYTGLNSASKKLHKLIKDFSHCWFVSCSRYLELIG